MFHQSPRLRFCECPSVRFCGKDSTVPVPFPPLRSARLPSSHRQSRFLLVDIPESQSALQTLPESFPVPLRLPIRFPLLLRLLQTLSRFGLHPKEACRTLSHPTRILSHFRNRHFPSHYLRQNHHFRSQTLRQNRFLRPTDLNFRFPIPTHC